MTFNSQSFITFDVPACGNTAAAQRTANPGDTALPKINMEYSQSVPLSARGRMCWKQGRTSHVLNLTLAGHFLWHIITNNNHTFLNIPGCFLFCWLQETGSFYSITCRLTNKFLIFHFQKGTQFLKEMVAIVLFLFPLKWASFQERCTKILKVKKKKFKRTVKLSQKSLKWNIFFLYWHCGSGTELSRCSRRRSGRWVLTTA